MSFGMRVFNGLGEVVADTAGGPLFARVRVATISFDDSEDIGGTTHYGYDFPTSGGAALQAFDEVRLVELPNNNDWVCFFGYTISVTFFGSTFTNQFPGSWLISNRPSLTVHVFRPISSLPAPPSDSYGISVFGDNGDQIWNTEFLLSRVSGSFYENPESTSDAFVNNKIWGNITDPFGIGEDIVNVNSTTPCFPENPGNNPTFFQGVVARRTSNTNIQIRNQRVDRIDFSIPSGFGFLGSSINALTGTGTVVVSAPPETQMSGSWDMTAAGNKEIGYLQGSFGSLSNTSGNLPNRQVYEVDGGGTSNPRRSTIAFTGNFESIAQSKSLVVDGVEFTMASANGISYDLGSDTTTIFWENDTGPIYEEGETYACSIIDST